MPRFRVAIDIGGGFADLVAVNEETGEVFWSKAPVTEGDFTDCVHEVFRRSQVEPEQVSQLLHGQTLVINAILQRRGAQTGLITTRGFRDILALQRANRRDIFNLRYRKPEPFVPRHRVVEVGERTSAEGKILREIDPNQLRGAYQHLLEQGVESIAIAFVNSYANPANEARAQELIRSFNGSAVPVSISSDISREWREYERTSTCVLNAHVMPLMSRYLDRFSGRFRDLGMNGTLYMMLSSGGVASFEYAAQRPIETVESGPVAGIIGAVKLAERMGEMNYIAFDGGSTTTKASLIQGSHPRFTTDYFVERDEFTPGYPIKIPVGDISEIGNGGGSIAWVDDTGRLRVGPLSAGAHPGPACYGWGGRKPTLTDAYLATGFLNAENFLGGTFKLHTELAESAIAPIAKHFAISVVEAAWAIVRIGNDNASHLLRRISAQRGFDPRDFALIAYGGSGPMMAPFLAAELEIPKVIIPGIRPGNFSAWGLLMSDLKHSLGQTLVHRLDAPDIVELANRVVNSLTRDVENLYRTEGIAAGIVMERTADLRYYGQEHTINVPIDDKEMTPENLRELSARFNEVHHREYGFALPGAVEVVNIRVSGTVGVPKPAPQPYRSSTRQLSEAQTGERAAHWGTSHPPTAVYQRDLLPVGVDIPAPAIVEEPSTTILIPESFRARVDEMGNLILQRGSV